MHDHGTSESPAVATGNPESAPPTTRTVRDNQSGGESDSTSTDDLAPPSPTLDIPEVATGPSIAANTQATNQPPRAESTRNIQKWFRLAGTDFVAEKWFAWRASRELLDLYKRIHRDEPQLTGRALYEQVVIRRAGMDVKAAAGVLRRAEQSFCDWPSGRDLRFRDLVLYVVFVEYLQSHVTSHGTRTNLGRIVARVIPTDL